MLKNLWLIAPATLAMVSGGAGAQTLAEDFTKANITNNWAVKGTPGACLTAGTTGNNNQTAGSSKYSSIPGCNLTTPDAVGAGALRLTKATTNQNGAIVWNDTFPTNKGLQVTFTTHTYGGSTATPSSGNPFPKGFQGADGISFFLMDGAKQPNIGAWGGSLGYSCSNGNGTGDGLEGAYLGLGMDEFGNFLNSGDNTSTGVLVASTVASLKGYNSYGHDTTFQANRIGLRGAGSVNWKTLNAAYPNQYKSNYDDNVKGLMVRNTCRTGLVQEMSGNNSVTKAGNTAVPNYKAITGGYWVLPDNQLIAKVGSSVTRAQATPITYRLMITPGGLLNFMYSYNGTSYQPVLTNWPITTDNGALPSTFRFGFAAATGGSTNIHEISCFVAEPTESTSSAGANTVQAGQVRTGTQVYLASFNPNNWAGSLVSADLVNSGGVVSISTAYNWDLNCVLTGGGCASMGTTNGVPTNTITVQAPSARVILTHNGTAGVPLLWDSLTTAQKTILKGTDTDAVAQERLDWLRGGRSKEQTATPAGLLRARGGVLGDIVDSSPTWVGPPSLAYGAAIKDAFYGTGSETSYTTWSASLAQRTHVVYAGSNDGLLHGARAGSNDSLGKYVGTANDGREVLSFMPPSVLKSSKIVDLTKPTYGHEYFVDAAPGTGDVFYGGAWHTWLVGGLGPGGKEIFALDVTNPSTFSDTNAPTIVRGAWDSTTLTNLGFTYGTPLVRRMHNGQWAIIFGNGIGSSSHLGGIYIGLIDKTSGAVTFTWLSTGAGTSTSKNGITNVASGDLDGDRVADYLYAGDLLGNVWRFDVTSSNKADWVVSKYGKTVATPLFTAKNSSGGIQPITSRLSVASVLSAGARRVILGLGTGRSVPFTNTVATDYEDGTQTVYGLWDWDMIDWNSGRTTSNSVTIPASPSEFASLPKTTAQYDRDDLSVNTLATSSSASQRELAENTVCWSGSTACALNNVQYGWRFDMPTTGEQLIYNPIFTDGVLVLNTTIPPSNTVGQCTPALPSGWTMAFKMDGGGGGKQNLFPDSAGSLIVATGHKSIVGIKQSAVGTPYIVTVGSNRYIINQTIGGNPKVNKINPQGGVSVKRISLEQLR
jgi:type IV pilus assembly protein PilY1